MSPPAKRLAIGTLLLVACSKQPEPAAVIDAGKVTSAPVDATAAPQPPAPPPGMVHVPGGTFTMGTDRGMPFEGPPHTETVRPFFLDAYEVTTAAFAKFVAETHYVTAAERTGESSVFDTAKNTWTVVKHASWKDPDGRTKSREREPVVHVAWSDADAYCHWTGGRLPTEVEWERAARGGLESGRFPWGDDELGATDGGARANTWQGRFPVHDDGSDGFRGVAPVGSFPPNGYGLFDMAGNVWEWTDAFFDDKARSADASVVERVIRGGSWLCSPSHCVGYRVAARGKAASGDGTNHIGFRCARDL